MAARRIWFAGQGCDTCDSMQSEKGEIVTIEGKELAARNNTKASATSERAAPAKQHLPNDYSREYYWTLTLPGPASVCMYPMVIYTEKRSHLAHTC